jgi:hypothetical protein
VSNPPLKASTTFFFAILIYTERGGTGLTYLPTPLPVIHHYNSVGFDQLLMNLVHRNVLPEEDAEQ